MLVVGCVPSGYAQSWIAQMRNADQKVAEGAWKEAAQLYTSVINATPDVTARIECLQQRASCYKHLDTFDMAQADYEQALLMTQDDDVRAVVSYNMSDLLIQTGQYARTISLLGTIRFEQKEQEFRRLANLATAYAYAAQLDKALALLDSVISQYTEQDRTHALLLQNRGFIHWDMKQYAQALKDMQVALPQLKDNEHFITLANMALVEAELGQFDLALEHIGKALAWQAQAPGIGTGHSTYIISLRKKAEILMKAKRLAEAALVYKSYFKAEKEYVRHNFSMMTEQARLDFWLKENPLVSEIFAFGNVEAPFLYDVALFRRNIALMGSATARQPARISALLDHSCSSVTSKLLPHEAAAEFVCYEDLLSGDSVYAALVCDRTGTRYVPIARKNDIHGYRVAGTSLRAAVCSGARFAQVVYTDSLLAKKVWAPLCAVLPKDTRRLYFAPEGIFQMLGIEYLPYAPLARIELHRVSSTDKIHCADVPFSGKALVLGGLNYSEEDRRSEVADSTKGNQTAYRMAMKLCGRALSFKNLPATVPEADTVAHIMGTVYDKLMWEDELKKSMGKYQVVHLATHGYSLQVSLDCPSVSMRDSMRHDNSLWACGIALTGANVEGKLDRTEDGLLSAREVCDLDLSKVRFVTLSACQTAQGVVSDEGPAGMLRALKKAGVGTVIATLWAVNDKSTRLFMKAFYEAWRTEHKDVHAAFKQAQRFVRDYAIPQTERRLPISLHRATSVPQNKAVQPRMIHPYKSPQYWAPFILID